MNKSPQEQADKLVNDVHVLWCDTPRRLTVPAAVREAIPLPELIAVAMAADDYASITEEDSAAYRNTYKRLLTSLEALRATGKVTL